MFDCFCFLSQAPSFIVFVLTVVLCGATLVGVLYTYRAVVRQLCPVWYGMGMVRVWYGYGMGMVWYGMVLYGMVWFGKVWYGMVWYGMVWYGMVLCQICIQYHMRYTMPFDII